MGTKRRRQKDPHLTRQVRQARGEIVQMQSSRASMLAAEARRRGGIVSPPAGLDEEYREFIGDDGVWQMPWVPPKPAEIPDWRAAMVAQTRTMGEIEVTAAVLADGRGSLLPNVGDAFSAAMVLQTEERERLSRAVLYYATPDMARLAVASSRSLPDFRLDAEDVPSRHGFIVFGAPIGDYVSNDSGHPCRTQITAISWGPFNAGGSWARGGIWVTFWSPVDYDHQEYVAKRQGRVMTEQWRRNLRTLRASPLAWDNESAVQFGATQSQINEAGLNPASAETTLPWIQVIRSAWLLMRQPGIASTTSEDQPRSARRRSQREHLDPGPVRIVHLRERRHISPPAQGEGERAPVDWSCRWIVGADDGGFWRNQWYPKQARHKPRWILPYVKGPADKPLRTRETVHVWDK